MAFTITNDPAVVIERTDFAGTDHPLSAEPDDPEIMDVDVLA